MRKRSIFKFLLIALCCCSYFRGGAQTDNYASYITDSSADFQNAFRITDNSRTNYGYLSNLLTLLSTSYVRVGFGVSGTAGDAVNVVVQGTGEILGASLLSNITLRLYDSLGTNVANGSGSSLLELYLLSGGTHTYAVRFRTNPTDNYRYKEVRVEFNNILSVSLLPQFRVYGVYYQKQCPAIEATSVNAFGTNSLLTGYVDNPTFATDASTTNYASLVVPLNLLSILPPAYLDLNFASPGKGGDYIGFTVAEGGALLSAGLLGNVNIDAYNSAGSLVASKNGFSLLDLKLLGGGTGKYMLGFVTTPGSYNIARIKITLNGVLNLLQDLHVYNAFHYRIDNAPVAITASGPLDVCAGGSVTLTAADPNGGTTYLWSNGATTSSITVSTSGVYSVQVSDAYSCTRYSIPVTVTILPAVAPDIAGDLTLCPGTTGSLHTTATYPAYLWNTGAITASINITTPGRYYVRVTDASGCTGSDTVIVGANNLNIASTINNATCTYSTDGSIALTTTGGSGTYTYLWSTGSTAASIASLAPGVYTCTIRDNVSGCSVVRSFTVAVKANLSLRSSVINTSDSNKLDGGIQVKGIGGSGNFTYAWSNGANTPNVSGLGSGIYYVTVTDATFGCNIKDTFTIDDGHNPLTLSVSVTANTACNTSNGSATVSVAGGSGSYTYLWSTGATTATISGLTAGSYYVTVYDNIKKYRKGIRAVVPNATTLTITGTVTSSGCSASTGAISAVVAGGSGSYTYSWSNGATTASISALQPGTYILKVTDLVRGCTQQSVFAVSQSGGPAATLAATQPACDNNANGSITVTASGATNKYKWSNGATTKDITGLLPGMYSLIITDSVTGCSSVYNTSLLPKDQLMVTASPVTNTACPSAPNGAITLLVAGGVAPYTYSWSTGATSASLTNLAAGTYAVRVADNNGCSDSARATINSTAVPVTPDIAGDLTLCPGSTGSLHTTAAFSAYLWNTGATTASINITTAGRYYVRVTDVSGCTGSDTVIVAANNLNIASTINNATCTYSTDGSIALTTTGGSGTYTYLWSTGSTAASIASLAPGVYTCTIRDNVSGCSVVRSFTVAVKANLSVRSSVINTSDSNKLDGGIQVKGIGGSGNFTYAWSNGANTPNISGLSSGIYYVTVTDATFGCNIKDTFTVDDGHNPLTLSVSVTTNSACNTSNGSATVSVAGGSGSYTYLWSTGATTASISGLTAGSYYVTVYDNVKKYRKGIRAVILNATTLTITGTVTSSACNASTGAISAVVAGGSGSYTYNWSNGASTASISALQPGTYLLRVTDLVRGCIQQSVFAVSQSGGPTATLAATQPACDNNANGSITVTASGATNKYKWSNGATTKDITGLLPGMYSLTITDSVTGCSSVYNTTLLPKDQLMVTASPVANTACPSAPNGVITLLVAGGVAPYTYSWSTGATSASITNLAAGNYAVRVADNNGCSDSARATIVNDDSRVLHAVVSGVIAASCNTAANGHAVVTASGGTAPYTYSWSNGAMSANLDNVAPGTYTATIHDAAGCVVTVNAVIGIDVANMLNVVIDSVINAGCTAAASGQIFAHAEKGAAPYTYLWSTGAATASITALVAGSYSVVATDATGCKDTAAASIIQSTPITASLSVTSTIKCAGGSDGSISATVGGGSGSYTYAWSNGSNAAGISNVSAGTYSLSVTDVATGCTATASYTLTQPAILQAQIAVTNESCLTNTGGATITATGGTAPYKYNWMGTASSNIISNLLKGDYTVGITDANGCNLGLTAHIGNDCDTNGNGNGNGGNGNGAINIHNVVTPNGDNANDVFLIEGLNPYPNASLQIFDKWGDVVYTQEHYRNTWGGTDKNGNILSSGTYYYILKLNATNIPGGKSEFAGFLMVQQ